MDTSRKLRLFTMVPKMLSDSSSLLVTLEIIFDPRLKSCLSMSYFAVRHELRVLFVEDAAKIL